ncbi:hypothetical protein ACFWPJ_12490, partial [Nocardia sp. NPDC058497]
MVFGAMAGGEAAGRATAGFGVFLVLGGLAFAFPTGGQGIRTTAIVFGCLTALCGLGSTASQMPPSLLGMLIGGAVGGRARPTHPPPVVEPHPPHSLLAPPPPPPP